MIALLSAPAGVELRAYTASDEPRVRRFLAELSPDTRYRRFFTGGALPERLVRRLLEADGRTRVVALLLDGDDVVGLAQCVPAAAGLRDIEVAVVVADAWQGRGLGPRLASYAVALAAAHGAQFVRATVHPENVHAIRAIRGRLPTARPLVADGVYEYRWPALS